MEPERRGNVVCSKCGADAYSKCPICRSIFPENGMDAILSWVLKFKTEGDWLNVSFFMQKEETEADALERLAKTFQAMLDESSNYPTPRAYACIHDWVMKPGCKPTIDCGHFGITSVTDKE